MISIFVIVLYCFLWENSDVLKDNQKSYHFKDRIIVSHIHAPNHAGPSYQSCSYVAQDVTVQVGHHQNIKLLGSGYHLGERMKETLCVVVCMCACVCACMHVCV